MKEWRYQEGGRGRCFLERECSIETRRQKLRESVCGGAKQSSKVKDCREVDVSSDGTIHAARKENLLIARVRF